MIEIKGANIHEIHGGFTIEDIPCDSGSSKALNLHWEYGDLYVSMSDTSFDDPVFIPDMRFRAGVGGANLSIIAEEFSIITNLSADDNTKSFRELSGDASRDIIKDFLPLRIITGSEEGSIRYKISDIIDDDQSPEEQSKFMDIVIMKNGNAAVTMRNTDHKIQSTILFNTEENGGSNPIMAIILNNIVKRIVEARWTNLEVPQ